MTPEEELEIVAQAVRKLRGDGLMEGAVIVRTEGGEHRVMFYDAAWYSGKYPASICVGNDIWVHFDWMAEQQFKGDR